MSRKGILLIGLLFIIFTSAFSILFTYDADSFNAFATYEKNGWYWCDSKDSYLEWYWFPIRNLPEVFYINFHLKMSNRVDKGGSGFYSEKMVALLLIGEDGEEILKRFVFALYNPLPVKFEDDSKGLGQDVYGSAEIRVDKREAEILRDRGFRIRLIWPPLDDRNVFAASVDARPVLSFVR